MKQRILLAFIGLMITVSMQAQIRNGITAKVKVRGNCEMCTARIEKAGSFKKISKVKYSLDDQTATITFDTTQTNLSIILQKIADAGHDNEKYTAPDEVYDQLPECCKYARKED